MSNQQKSGGGQSAAPKQKTLRINGTDYTFQKMPLRSWIQIQDKCKNQHGHPIDEKLIDEVLKHIVVSPKVSLEDFDDQSELNEVVKEAITFQQGTSK